jgi:uncharacterized zinc-type alcohol dehydrogenase-like protein
MSSPDSIRAIAAVGEQDSTVKSWKYTPRPLQPEDIDIRIVACGVCHSDLHQVKKEWKQVKQQRPLVPGHEIVGIVIRAGPKSIHKIGTRVAVGTCVGSCSTCELCKRGEENYCAKAVETYNGIHPATKTVTRGGFAERMIVDSRFAFQVPDSLPTTTAAPLMCAGATVYSPLKKYTNKESRVGIVGIGGLGHLGLQFARALGVKLVVAITTSSDKEKAAKSFGAHSVLVSTNVEQMKQANGSFDFLLVTVSADLKWADYLRLLTVDGRLCLVGLPPSGEMKLNPFALTGKRISVSGSNTAGMKDTREMLDLAAKAKIRVAVELLPLNEQGANEALRRVDQNLPRYRCVLVNEEFKEGSGGM